MKNHIYSKTIINRKYYRRTLTPRPILPTPLSKIPNLLSHETQHHLTYKTTLYSSRNFSFCKKERRKEKQQKPTAFSIPQSLHLAGERERRRDEEGGEKTGAIFATKRIWWAWILPSAADARANAGKNSFLRRWSLSSRAARRAIRRQRATALAIGAWRC